MKDINMINTLSIQKNPWTRPQLIVLGRNHPEEAVLTTCKCGDHTKSGPNNTHAQCLQNAGCVDGCQYLGLS